MLMINRICFHKNLNNTDLNSNLQGVQNETLTIYYINKWRHVNELIYMYYKLKHKNCYK